MLTFMQHLQWEFVVLPCLLIQKNCFSLSINRFRAHREILHVTLKITGFSPAPVKLLGSSSVQDEDLYMLVSTYELSISIPSRGGAAGCGTCEVPGVLLWRCSGLTHLGCNLQDCNVLLEHQLETPPLVPRGILEANWHEGEPEKNQIFLELLVGLSVSPQPRCLRGVRCLTYP